MKVYVGTSGWAYSWNLGSSLDWYINNTCLNAVELNASFYRFPFPSQIKAWASKGKSLRWAIKVNRFITHIFKLGQRAESTWKKFKRLFKPMDSLIDFYLFQMPPSFSWKARDKVERFFKKTRLKRRFALEPRHPSWFTPEAYKWARQLGLTWVSVDCPDLPRNIVSCGGIVYLRVHGRSAWYAHCYTRTELKQIAQRIARAKPKLVYVFFNNDHDMRANAEAMFKILKR